MQLAIFQKFFILEKFSSLRFFSQMQKNLLQGSLIEY